MKTETAMWPEFPNGGKATVEKIKSFNKYFVQGQIVHANMFFNK